MRFSLQNRENPNDILQNSCTFASKTKNSYQNYNKKENSYENK